jgi:preprotein translocase subunit SecA
MAGRGTDIVLGHGVPELGGLHILGTERHESRRIDNQLRGRSGRQGDPGSSRFFLSLEDDLLRIFGGERIQGMMGRLGMEEGEPIEHNMISKAIENSQRKVEGHNFEIREHLLKYDNVMNQQREVVYTRRREILAGDEEYLREETFAMIEDLADGLIESFTDEKTFPEEWDLESLKAEAFKLFNLRLDLSDHDALNQEDLREDIAARARELFLQREKEFGPQVMAELQKYILLQSLDTQWKDHLLSMDHLKEGIGLRGYGQRDPLREYQREGYETFLDMLDRIKADSVSFIFHVRLQTEEDLQAVAPKEQEMQLSHGGEEPERPQPVKRKGKKVGRNDPCPCGSGKKYKKCCGAAA